MGKYKQHIGIRAIHLFVQGKYANLIQKNETQNRLSLNDEHQQIDTTGCLLLQ